MRPSASAGPLDHDDLRLSASLIRRCGLTGEDVRRVALAERAMGVRFCDAALSLGIVSQEDILAAQMPDSRVTPLKRKACPSQQLTIAHDPYATHSEAIRALRTELLLRRQGGGGAEVVAVVSACPGEGRSRLAAELAIAFSQLGRPTLLVDADLRRPRQHELFEADNQHGLADAIAGGGSPCVQQVAGLRHLSLLTAGVAVPNPLELLSDDRFESMLGDWRRAFAYVVFDTSPVSLYSDGLAVARLARRVLAVTRAAHTPYPKLRDLQRRLFNTQSQILGAVINHF